MKKIILVVGVIFVLAGLSGCAVGACVAFDGIQTNARRSAMHSDAARLAGALNNYNVSNKPENMLITVRDVTNRLGADGMFTLVIPERGVVPAMDISVQFESAEHAREVLRFIVLRDEIWRVDEDAINRDVN